MSFMIVKHREGGQRAFYLNLRAQTEVLSFSRDQFDQAVTDFITAQSTAGLESIAAAIDAAATIDESAPTSVWCFTVCDQGSAFHSSRSSTSNS